MNIIEVIYDGPNEVALKCFFNIECVHNEIEKDGWGRLEIHHTFKDECSLRLIG